MFGCALVYSEHLFILCCLLSFILLFITHVTVSCEIKLILRSTTYLFHCIHFFDFFSHCVYSTFFKELLSLITHNIHRQLDYVVLVARNGSCGSFLYLLFHPHHRVHTQNSGLSLFYIILNKSQNIYDPSLTGSIQKGHLTMIPIQPWPIVGKNSCSCSNAR